MGITHLSNIEFTQEVLQSRQPALVDFWAPWCGPCRMLTPILEEISREYGDKIKICKINVDENQALATKYQVLSIPTVLFFKAGKIVGQVVGIKSKSEIKKIIDSLIG